MIRKTRRWFHTLGKKPRCYRVNDVTYIVTSKFERNGTEHTMQTRVAEAIKKRYGRGSTVATEKNVYTE